MAYNILCQPNTRRRLKPFHLPRQGASLRARRPDTLYTWRGGTSYRRDELRESPTDTLRRLKSLHLGPESPKYPSD